MSINVHGKKDFEAKVLPGVFPNVISNLIKNASLHGGVSKVDITIDEDKRTLSIRDNGKGIPADIVPRIFDLHFTTARHEKKGSGVRLSFVKITVSASAGKISCHSRHGDKDSFTAFIIAFPDV